MGQEAVKVAIQAALQAANFPLVGTIFPSRDYIQEEDYEINAVAHYTQSINGSGCVLVVNMPGPDVRTRKALTGRGSVNDMNIHPIVLELFFASTLGDPIIAQTEYNSVVDAIVPMIRNNPNMSAPSTVWSAGEYRAGVTHNSSGAFTGADGTTIFIIGTIAFEAWEQIVGTGV